MRSICDSLLIFNFVFSNNTSENQGHLKLAMLRISKLTVQVPKINIVYTVLHCQVFVYISVT